jgi:hypothetical protein
MPELVLNPKLRSLKWPTRHLLCRMHTRHKAIRMTATLLRMVNTMANSLKEVLHLRKDTETSISRLHKTNSHHEVLLQHHPEPMAFQAVQRVVSMVFLAGLLLMGNKMVHHGKLHLPQTHSLLIHRQFELA